ncbi:MAG: hypothetical protein ACYTG1_01075 [Planctomycetota bacterium]|jgi:hypothetical protein
MTDITSRTLLVVKGLLFLLMLVLAAGSILLLVPDWRVAVLLGVVAWSAARFYYFLFYVLERYVDPRLRYAGVLALLRAGLRRGAASADVERPG